MDSQPKHSDALPEDVAPGLSDPANETTETIAQLREEITRLTEQLQRNQADFLNSQKRARAQADVDRLYAIGDLARDLLDVLDNCERGAEAARAPGATEIGEGFAMVHRQLLGVLAKHGVEPIEALGQPFNPNLHEAILQQPADEQHPEGSVTAVLNRGYKIRDRVLRPSKVAVASSA